MKKVLIILFALSIFFLVGWIAYSVFLPKEEPLFSQPENTYSQDSYPQPQRPTPLVYGYLPYWTRSDAIFHAEMNTVSYFSLGIQADGKILDLPKEKQETGYRAYQKGVLSNLRSEIRSDQKLDLTISMMDQEAIPLFINSSTARQQFLTDLTTLISSAPIDGINIDIEYNGLVDDALQANLTSLIEQAQKILKSHSPSLTLSIATYGDAGSLQRITDLQALAPHVDHIIMMAYDYHRGSSPRAGPNSPLYGKAKQKWAADILSDLKAYTDVVPPEKILLGIPFYGYQWQIEDGMNQNSFTIPKTGASVMYKYIPSILSLPGAAQFWDSDAFSPYVLFGKGEKRYVLYYDNPLSLSYKLKLVKEAGLGGIAIWAAGYEGETTALWETIRTEL